MNGAFQNSWNDSNAESDRGTKRSFGEREVGGGPGGPLGGPHGGPLGGQGGPHGGPFQGGGAPGFNMDGDMGSAIRCQIFGQDLWMSRTWLVASVERVQYQLAAEKRMLHPLELEHNPSHLANCR